MPVQERGEVIRVGSQAGEGEKGETSEKKPKAPSQMHREIGIRGGKTSLPWRWGGAVKAVGTGEKSVSRAIGGANSQNLVSRGGTPNGLAQKEGP